MKRTLLSLILCITMGISYAAELNIYASGLKCSELNANRQITISYFLNAPATTLEFQLINSKSTIVQTIAITSASNLTKGQHNNVVINLGDYLPTGEYSWAIKATNSTSNASITRVSGTDKRFSFYSPAGMVVDNSYNSPHFGRIYVSESRDNKISNSSTVKRTTTQGIYIFGPDLTDVTSQEDIAYDGGVAWNEDTNYENTIEQWVYGMYAPARLATDEEGLLYVCDNGAPSKGTSGIWRMNPADPSADFEEVLATNKRGTIYTRANSIAVSGIGENRILYVIDNNASHTPVLKQFPIGNTTEYSTAGTALITALGTMHSLNTLIRGIYNDFWIFQYRGQIDAYSSIRHYNSDLELDYQVNNSNNPSLLPASNPNRRGVGALSPDGKLLAVHAEQTIRIFDVTYDANKVPSLANERTISGVTGSNVDCIAFDVANNIYFASATREYFYAYALPKNTNTHTTPAPSTQTISIPAPNPTNVVPRIAVHNLNVKIDGSCYNFNFDTNSAATAGKILFYDESDNKVGEIQISQAIKKGHNEVLIPMNEIPSKNDLCWGVELTGKDMEQYICRYNHTYFSQFKFYRPQDLITDNNPQSDCFGRTYITYPADGNKFNKQLGIFVLNHMFDSIAEGLKPTGMTIGNNERRIMHRIKIGPNGKIYVLDSDNNKIYEMEASATAPILHDNGSAKNIVANIDAITNVNEFCFKDDGTMYVLNNPYYSQDTDGGTGTLYKVVDGVATQFVTFANANSNLFATVDNSMEMDGRGGIWLAQARNQWDKFPPLMHINSKGEIDFSVTIKSSAALKALFPNVTQNLATRGSMAYNVKEDLLAFGGGGYVTLFKVSYDANNVPTLTKWLETPYIGERIDGICFDYVGNMFVMSASSERFYAFAIPQVTNKVSVRAQNKKTVHRIIPLEDTKDNTTLLTDYKNEEEEVFVFRSLTAGMYNTLCLPFDVDNLTGTPLEDATVWQYNGATVENEATNKEIFLNFEEVTAIEAGKPYLVEPATDIVAPMEFKNVTISVTDGSNVTQSVVTMHGILHPTELQANDKSILFLVANNNLAWANVTANMNGMRAYFKVNDPSLLSARTHAYIRREPTVTTDMENITTTETEIKKVIYNNNLYILRGEEVYTIQGNRIK